MPVGQTPGAGQGAFTNDVASADNAINSNNLDAQNALNTQVDNQVNDAEEAGKVQSAFAQAEQTIIGDMV